jgi:hypothetical protein
MHETTTVHHHEYSAAPPATPPRAPERTRQDLDDISKALDALRGRVPAGDPDDGAVRAAYARIEDVKRDVAALHAEREQKTLIVGGLASDGDHVESRPSPPEIDVMPLAAEPARPAAEDDEPVQGGFIVRKFYSERKDTRVLPGREEEIAEKMVAVSEPMEAVRSLKSVIADVVALRRLIHEVQGAKSTREADVHATAAGEMLTALSRQLGALHEERERTSTDGGPLKAPEPDRVLMNRCDLDELARVDVRKDDEIDSLRALDVHLRHVLDMHRVPDARTMAVENLAGAVDGALIERESAGARATELRTAIDALERYERAAKKIWTLFPADPLPNPESAHLFIERLEAIIERGLLVPRGAATLTGGPRLDGTRNANVVGAVVGFHPQYGARGVLEVELAGGAGFVCVVPRYVDVRAPQGMQPYPTDEEAQRRTCPRCGLEGLLEDVRIDGPDEILRYRCKRVHGWERRRRLPAFLNTTETLAGPVEGGDTKLDIFFALDARARYCRGRWEVELRGAPFVLDAFARAEQAGTFGHLYAIEAQAGDGAPDGVTAIVIAEGLRLAGEGRPVRPTFGTAHPPKTELRPAPAARAEQAAFPIGTRVWFMECGSMPGGPYVAARPDGKPAFGRVVVRSIGSDAQDCYYEVEVEQPHDGPNVVSVPGRAGVIGEARS